MTTSFSLYNLSESATKLLDMIQNGEIAQEQIQETLDAMLDNVEQGVKDLGGVHQELTPQIDAIDVQIKRLQSRKKMLVERKEKLKSTIGYVMHTHNLKKVPTELFTVINKKGTPSVEIVSQDSLPDDCITVKVTETANKTEIKKRLMNGDDLGGAAKLVTPEYVTQIS